MNEEPSDIVKEFCEKDIVPVVWAKTEEIWRIDIAIQIVNAA